MTISLGLKFKKFDLHIHTPASKDFKDRGATAEDIVNTAVSKDLTGIAITDHQTAEWVDKVKDAARGKDLIVFPGVELLVTGGEQGIHILIIFDVDKNADHINRFLNTLRVYKKNGGKTLAAEVTVGGVADELKRYDPSAILILAHCHSSKGVTGDMKGETRTLIFEPRRKCLLGAEANESDFLNEEKKEKHTRVVDCLDGTDSNYYNRKLGVYQSSDAHSLSEIGANYTYFKVDDQINIEDIRQALIDRDTRIRQSFEYQGTTYQRIDTLEITSGFLTGQKLKFHEGLNSILGSKGSGKSLVIEFLRFGLNQQPIGGNLKEDHDFKLEKCLKLHGEVKITLTDDSGKKYLIKRVYNPGEANPIEIIDMNDGTKKEFQVEQVFPVLFLSQNEVIRIAEDKTGERQREFIDRFFDFYKYQEEIGRLNKRLDEIDSRFADILKAHLISLKLKRKVKIYREEIDKIGRQIKNKVFQEYSKKEKLGRAIRNQVSFLETLEESLKDTKLEYEDLTPPMDEKEVNSDPAVKRSLDVTSNVLEKITSNVGGLISLVKSKKEKVEKEYKDWESEFVVIKKEYDELVRKSGGTEMILDQKRKKLINGLSKIEKDLTRYQGRAVQMSSIAEKRKEAIKKLEEAYKAYFEKRKDRCEHFTKHSEGSLNVTVKESEDKSSFRENLMQLKRGSWLKDEEIEIISNKISPREFIDNVLRYEWTERKIKDSLQEISAKTAIGIENVERLVQHLLGEYEYKEILELLYTSIPEDVPLISYRVGDSFKELDELSVGQKAIALLIIALSDGRFPIVIDQPEDSLDLRSIWEDVCSKLRGSKDKRQFIFTTHNSSVAVASDTDKFTILRADASHGKVLHSGSINKDDVKKEVMGYLEGGKGTYDKKRHKYNL